MIAALVSAVALTVTPASSLADQPVDIAVHGLPPRSLATVSLTSTDAAGTTWSSSARFRANAHGVVDLARQAPISGYAGVWEVGLNALLRPSRPVAYRWKGTRPLRFAVTVAEGGTVVARTSYRRRLTPMPFREAEPTVARDGFAGFYFAPKRPLGAILLTGGSQGGDYPLLIETAAHLAAHGYAALAVGYFGLPGLPRRLRLIPLDYFVHAIGWLQRTSGWLGRVTVLGTSYGSEAALLVGAHFPGVVNRVVGVVPSAVVTPGYHGETSAWTLRGHPLPDGFLSAAAVIPVERIHGGLMTVCAGSDEIWPSCTFAGEIAERRRAHGVAVHDVRVRAAGADHFEAAELVPDAPGIVATDPDPTALAGERDRERIWPQLLRFLGATP